MLSIGDTVKVHYTGQFANGDVFDSTLDGDAIFFTLGDEMMIDGFEKAVMNMKEGERKTVELKAIDAYGEYDKDLITEVDKKEFIGDKQINIGDTLQAPTEDGVVVLKILEIKDKTIVLDANSDLAGKDVVFDIELLEVRKGDMFDDEFNENELGSFDDEFSSGDSDSEDYHDVEDY